MSEKRLIDFETLGRIINIFKLAPETNLNDVFDELPKPTLPDVCGTRKLDSMTEEEARELLSMRINLAKTKGLDIRKYCNASNSITICYIYDNCLNFVDIKMGKVEPAEFADPIKVVRWFLEKGFNVWEEK